MEKRCINLDWLELYCKEDAKRFPMNADYFRERGYVVNERAYGTRVYAEMFTIEDDFGNPFIEVRRHPLSDVAKDGGLFPAESCHLRLSNYACYAPDPIGDVRRFIVDNGYTLVRIFRIDLCLDFKKFDKGDDPARFVRRYISGKYSKINQTNVSAHGKDLWESRSFNSLSWGAKKSMIGTKMYNKSLELAEQHDKPYIRYSWYLAGLIDNPITGTCKDADGVISKPDIWRVEFSIKSSAKRWFIMEDCNRHKKSTLYMPHTLDMYDDRWKLLTVFASLAHHYFHFKVFEEGKRKDRCEDKVLFAFSPSDIVLSPTGNASSKPSNSKLERLIRYLQAYRATLLDDGTICIVDKLLDILRSKQVFQFAGSEMSAEDVLVLQRLVSERVGDLHDSQKRHAQQNIKALVHDLFENSF